MAVYAHNTPRRDFLKGMIVTSAMASAAAKATRHAAPNNRTQQAWNRALADYQAKRAYAENVDNGDAAFSAWVDATDNIVCDTLAPTLDALRMKLEWMRAYYEAEDWLARLLPALIRNAAHLAGGVA